MNAPKETDALNCSSAQQEESENWSQNRCSNCNALLYEVNEEKFTEGSVRIKCRLCKQIEVQ